MSSRIETRRRRPLRTRRSGYTILEVLIAVLILSIGAVAMLGLQTVAVANQRVTQDQQVAILLAETVLERLKRDSLMWNSGAETWVGTAQTTMPWLAKGMAARLLPDPAQRWRRPPDPFNAGDDSLYNDLGIAADSGAAIGSGAGRYLKNQNFCVEYRMSEVVLGRFARAEVVVFWPFNDAGVALFGDCSQTAAMRTSPNVRSVQLTGAVFCHDAGGGLCIN